MGLAARCGRSLAESMGLHVHALGEPVGSFDLSRMPRLERRRLQEEPDLARARPGLAAVSLSPLIVGHRRCEFRPWTNFWHVVYPHQALPPVAGGLDCVLEAHQDLEALHNNRTGEYYYLFGLRREIERRRQHFGDAIMIVHYRRFLADRPLGPMSPNVPWASVVTPRQAEQLDPLALMPALSRQTGWFVGRPIAFEGGLVSQFAANHPVEHFLRFLACAVETGVLKPWQLPGLLSRDSLLLPAPSVGMLPTGFFVETMTRLEACARHFLDNGFRELADDQRRILGFSLERLHSFLLLQEIERRGLDLAGITGTQTVVNAEGAVIRPSA